MYPHDATTTRKLRQRAPQIHPGLTRTSSFFPPHFKAASIFSFSSSTQDQRASQFSESSTMASSSTTMCCGSCLASKGSSKRLQANSPAIGTSPSSTMVVASSRIGGGKSYETRDDKLSGLPLCRRSLVLSGIPLVSSLVGLEFPPKGTAVVKQSLLAGRVPGLSEPDEEGWRTYRRPDEKSGGHGVGWSPIIPYTFSVPPGWEEVPVSIADLGGTEIDLRFANSKEGRLFVIVAPVLRFSDDLGDNATIEKIGTPEKVINAFGPEVIGENVEGRVLSTQVAEHSGRKYYQFELEPPHIIITATAAGNRLYLFNVTANGLQWKRHYGDLKRIASSFRVV